MGILANGGVPMSSFYEKVCAETHDANERDAIEYIKNLIMGYALRGECRVLLDDVDTEKFNDSVDEYLRQQGFKIGKSEKGITISWLEEF
jgi:hypothetical protein